MPSSIHLRTPPSVDDTPKQNNTETLQTHATIDLTSDRLESPRITLNHGSFADAARSAPVSGTFVPLANCNNLLYNGRTFIRPNTQVRQQPTTETDWDVAFVANEIWTGLSGRKSIESEAVKSVSESPRQAQTKTNGVDKQNSHHGGSDFNTEKKSEHTVPNRTEQLDKEIFVGARREPVTRYHLSNIGKESTRSGILMHFEQNGIEVTQLRIFTTRYGNLYARINVPSVFADKVESDEFPLPGGVILSKWLSRPQVQARNRQKPTSTRRRRGQYQDIGNGSEMEYSTRYNKLRKAYRKRDAPGQTRKTYQTYRDDYNTTNFWDEDEYDVSARRDNYDYSDHDYKRSRRRRYDNAEYDDYEQTDDTHIYNGQRNQYEKRPDLSAPSNKETRYRDVD